MNGHGVGRFQLGEHIEGVFRRPVVKLDGHRLFLKVDVRDRADIAVEYAGSRAKSVGPFPHYIIVIPDLHYPIAGSEGKISVFFFLFCPPQADSARPAAQDSTPLCPSRACGWG